MDLAFFAEHPSIKIMEVLNTEGEIAFLLRPQYKKYNYVIDTILNVEPNYISISKTLKEKYPEKDVKIADVIPDINVRKEMFKIIVKKLLNDGVFICNYVNEMTASKIDFSTFKEIKNYDTNIEKSNIIMSDNVENDLDFLYMENGEDGYEQ